MLLIATMIISTSSLISVVVDMSIDNPVFSQLECIGLASIDLVNHSLATLEEDNEEEWILVRHESLRELPSLDVRSERFLFLKHANRSKDTQADLIDCLY